MSEQRYKIVFLGLSDDLPDTERRLKQNISKILKTGEARIDNLIAKSPVVIRKNINREEADSIAKKLQMIGGRVSIESDKSVVVQNDEKTPEGKKTATFKLYINEIDSEESKHTISRYLNRTLDIDYKNIRHRLLKQVPTVLPFEFGYEEAKDIRFTLEEFGSKVSIIEVRKDDFRSYEHHAKTNKKNIAVVLSVLLILFFTFIFLRNSHKYENKGSETGNDKTENRVVEARGRKTDNEGHLPLAREAMKALKRLEAAFQGGISYSDYMQEFGNAKHSVNLFLESQEARKRFLLTNSIRNAMVHVKNAAKVWEYKSKYGRDYVQKTRGDVQLYLNLYPDANKPRELGGARGDTGELNDVIWIDSLLSIIMNEASKELNRVSDL